MIVIIIVVVVNIILSIAIQSTVTLQNDGHIFDADVHVYLKEEISVFRMPKILFLLAIISYLSILPLVVGGVYWRATAAAQELH